MSIKPNSVLLCNILLVVVFFHLFTPTVSASGPVYQLHETRNGTLRVLRGDFLNILIDCNSWVYFRYAKLESFTNFNQRIEDIIEEENIKELRVALRVDQNVEFGTVQRVLKLIKDAGIKKVTLISGYRVSVLDVMRNQGEKNAGK